MEPFYLTHEEFWDWFHLDKSTLVAEPSVKRVKTKHQAYQAEATAALATARTRYICLYGKHRPGKKTKVWEGDGYLSITSNNMGHLVDLKGRLLEEPVILEETDLESGEELQIGTTEVQIVELDGTC